MAQGKGIVMLRRDMLKAMLALVASPAIASAQQTTEPGLQLGQARAFHPDQIIELARQRANQAYEQRASIPKPWLEISYDDYRSIWFDTRNALWERQSDVPLRLDVFAPGLYFPHPIALNIVENGQSRQIPFSMDVFDRTDKFPDLPVGESLGYSGLRLRAELERAGIYQEFAVFQGASYFRAIGTGNIYGLSARGLALDVAGPDGEEFPEFVAFWLEKPSDGAQTFTLHALMDSPSCTGAFRFDITHGQPLEMDVDATFFTRGTVEHAGAAPLTSMFQFDETNRDRFSDFRPAVHDSDGLLIRNGAGETLWRPLANPRNLQISSFLDENPRGFGLMQRARKFGDFADLEAHYHKRPGLWVEPQGDWGKGAITLVEIPTDKEIYDNIVAYWRPSEPWQPGQAQHLRYRLYWGGDSNYGQGLRVLNTRIGAAFEAGIIIAIDFEPGDDVPADLSQITKHIRASAGQVSSGVLQQNPETGGPRLTFRFHPEGADLIEFRAELRLDDKPLSETWLYRWTA